MEFKRLQYGTLNDDMELYKKVCSKVTEFRPLNNEYFTLEELFEVSGVDEKTFNDRSMSFYIGMEEDDWNPCKEICALCAIMKYDYKKEWFLTQENWIEI